MAEQQDKHDKQHKRNVDRYGRKIDAAYKEAIKEAVAITKMVSSVKDDAIFSFDDYPYLSKRVKRFLSILQQNIMLTVVNGIQAEWTLANNKNNELAHVVFGKKVDRLTEAQKHRYFSTNDKAREAFIARKENGLSLSDRVWRYADQFKEEIEMSLDIGIREGKSAAGMARDAQQYLQRPDMLFRRVRDEHGLLQLSKRAKAYHPGQGVYRSSYKNARRLAATETNIAYRTADYLRYQQLDFVVGIEIHLSGNHTLNGKPFRDICDELAGRYPKDFKFTGWHPNCRCFVTSILKTKEERDADVQKILRGEPLDGESVNRVKDVPENFKKWVRDNSDRMENAQKRGMLPYFVKDNMQAVDDVLNPKQKKLTTLEIAEQRHAARTPEQVDLIRRRAAYRAKTIRSAETLLSDFEGMDDVDTSALRDAVNHARWDDARSEALVLAQKKRSVIEKGISIKSELGGIKDVDLQKLQNAMASGKPSEIRIQSDALGKIKAEIEALSLLDDPMNVARETSFATAKVVQKAVERTMSRMPTDLESRKSELEFEIRWIEKEGAKRYPDTWKYSQDAYKKELAFVQKKIDVKSVADSVADAFAYYALSRSKDFRLLADEMRSILSSPDMDITAARAKAQQLNDKYNALQAKKQKKVETSPIEQIKFETIEDLKKRLGSEMPKTLLNLENAIEKYEESSLYGTKAKQHKGEIEALMRKIFDEHDLGMNIKDGILEAVLNSWFKNTFETGTSGGHLGSTITRGKIENSHKRLVAAHKLFGLGKNLNADQLARHEYEKYGNLLDHNIVESMSHNTAKQYGNVEVRFKKDKVIATWTAGDSLCKLYQPSLVSDPRSCSFDNLYETPTSSSIQTTDLAKFKTNHIRGYIELQYHGDLTVDCVESITFPYNPVDTEREEVARKWKEKGVKVYYIDNGTLCQL